MWIYKTVKTIIILAVAFLILPMVCMAAGPKAKHIRTDTANFDNVLSIADNNVQKALETIDELSVTETDPLSLHTADTDNVKDTHIDWGTGANQVNLDDVPDGTTYKLLTATKDGYIDQDVTSGSSPTFNNLAIDGGNITSTVDITLDPAGNDVILDNANLQIQSNYELRFYDNGNYVGFEAPALSADQIWVLPTADGTANQVLGTDGSGNLGWVDAGGGAFILDTAVVREDVSGAGNYATDDFVFGSPQLDDDADTDHDKRMFFDKSKGAFRAGCVTGSVWDETKVGDYSAAMGYNTTASGQYSFAVGGSTSATGIYSVAMGGSTQSGGAYSFAMGNTATTNGTASVAMGVYVGTGSTLAKNNTFVFGQGAGSGSSDRLYNNIPSSLMIGFNSNIPTLFVGTSSGAGTVGHIGVGTTNPQTALEIGKAGALRLSSSDEAEYGQLQMGDEDFTISTGGTNDRDILIQPARAVQISTG